MWRLQGIYAKIRGPYQDNPTEWHCLLLLLLLLRHWAGLALVRDKFWYMVGEGTGFAKRSVGCLRMLRPQLKLVLC